MMMRANQSGAFFDAHCHLSFAPDPECFAAWVAQKYSGAFSTTVSPVDFTCAQQLLAPWESLKVGFGAHPWWAASGEVTARDIEAVAGTIVQAPFIGEVGLDFGRNGLARSSFASDEETKATQVEVLRAILSLCAQDGSARRVFSFHAVQSADVVLDLLQEYELPSDSVPIFHWFSGSSAQLQRARELGCCFSVNTFMLNTKRGREYAKAIPANQLLIETDLPEGGGPAEGVDLPEGSDAIQGAVLSEGTEGDATLDAFEATCAQYAAALDSAYEQLAALRGSSILSALEQNVQRIFG